MKVWLILMLIAAGASTVISWLLLETIEIEELLAGWGLAGVNTGLGLTLSRRALGRTKGSFLLWGVLGHIIKFLLLLAILVAVWGSGKLTFNAVIIAFAPAFLVFLLGEGMMLMRWSNLPVALDGGGGGGRP